MLNCGKSFWARFFFLQIFEVCPLRASLFWHRLKMLINWFLKMYPLPWNASAMLVSSRSIAFLFGFSGSGSGWSPVKWAWASNLQSVSIPTTWMEGDFDLQASSSGAIAIAACRFTRASFSSDSGFSSGSFNRLRAEETSFFRSALWL